MLSLATWKDRKPLVGAIKPIYQAATAEAAVALDAFAQTERGRKFALPDACKRLWYKAFADLLSHRPIFTLDAYFLPANHTRSPAAPRSLAATLHRTIRDHSGFTALPA
ncbi:hypothetical protein BG58_41125 [Caballeronia jiangsuensis]|nr:hypothetical protein BG58_41125 [Caballeronia jiangsuensis]